MPKITKKEISYILKNYKGISQKDMMIRLAKLGYPHSSATIALAYKNLGIKSGLSGQFQKGQEPFNKGLPMVKWASSKSLKNIKKGQFKKGHINDNARPLKPIGTITTRADGYMWIKVAEPNKWKEYHKVVWEKENGKIPKGMRVFHLDQNPSNNNIENLMLISAKDSVRINYQGLTNDPDINKAMILTCRLFAKRKELNKC